MRSPLLVALGPFVASCLMAQQPVAADLTAPSLAVHAALPQNNRPGTPLQETMTRAAAVASARGLPSRDVASTTNDEPEALTDFQGLYRKLACETDAIIIGHATASVFHLSAAGRASTPTTM